MKARGRNRKPGRVGRSDGAGPEFPALRNFFSAYLHQDFRQEYDSPQFAAAAVLCDSSPAETAALRREWLAWRKQLGSASVAETAQAIRKLGGAWQPATPHDLDDLQQAIIGYSTEKPGTG